MQRYFDLNRDCPHSASVEAPYYSQFMSADLVEKYIHGEVALSTDPLWVQSGADNEDEYERWTWSDCGIACFKMILAAGDKKYASIPLVKLAKKAGEYGVFKIKDKKISPLYYAEFCSFVRSEYRLNAKSIPALSFCEIKGAISRGDFVIASVHPNIRNPESNPPKRGGHLILVVGYDDRSRGFYINNPSGFQSNGSQERVFVPYAQFRKFFAYRGIVIQRN